MERGSLLSTHILYRMLCIESNAPVAYRPDNLHAHVASFAILKVNHMRAIAMSKLPEMRSVRVLSEPAGWSVTIDLLSAYIPPFFERVINGPIKEGIPALMPILEFDREIPALDEMLRNIYDGGTDLECSVQRTCALPAEYNCSQA